MSRRTSKLPLVLAVLICLFFLLAGIVLASGGETLPGVLYLLVAGILGVLALTGGPADEAAARREADVAAAMPLGLAAAPAAAAETPPPASDKSAAADDLTKIEGVGPKIAGLLRAAQIATFADLGASEVSRLQEILTAAGSRYQLADPGTWPEQAALAAAGAWDDLEKLQDQLQGGRRV